MKEEWEPFEIIEDENGRTLSYDARKLRRKIIGATEVPLILDAIKLGMNVRISKATIDGDIDITVGQDEHARHTVTGYISINDSIINGRVSFHGTRLKRQVHFINTHFNEEPDFSNVCFGTQSIFSNAHFKCGANFSGTHFGQDANFGGTYFGQETLFGGAHFVMRAYFGGAHFDDIVNFSGAYFEKTADFGAVKIKYPAAFARVHIHEKTVCRAVLWNWVFRRLLRVPIWLVTIGKIRLPKATFTDVSSINTTTVMDASSNPRLKRYIDDEQWIESWRRNPKGRWWSGWWREGKWWREPVFWIWEGTSHCGRSIGLWASWSIFFACIFAVIYRAFGCDSIAFNVDKLAGKQPDFWAYLYHSIVTFTTLGFGDIVPLTNRARLAVGAEVVLGYVMLGGLISIFANKFARRS